MNNSKILIILLIPVYIFCQPEDYRKNSIGIYSNYDFRSGMKGEISYESAISNKISSGISGYSNFKEHYGLNLYLNYQLLKSSKYKLFSGLSYNYHRREITNNIVEKSSNIDIPITFKLWISNTLNLRFGISGLSIFKMEDDAIDLDSTGFHKSFPGHIRFGIDYNF